MMAAFDHAVDEGKLEASSIQRARQEIAAKDAALAEAEEALRELGRMEEQLRLAVAQTERLEVDNAGLHAALALAEAKAEAKVEAARRADPSSRSYASAREPQPPPAAHGHAVGHDRGHSLRGLRVAVRRSWHGLQAARAVREWLLAMSKERESRAILETVRIQTEHEMASPEQERRIHEAESLAEARVREAEGLFETEAESRLEAEQAWKGAVIRLDQYSTVARVAITQWDGAGPIHGTVSRLVLRWRDQARSDQLLALREDCSRLGDVADEMQRDVEHLLTLRDSMLQELTALRGLDPDAPGKVAELRALVEALQREGEAIALEKTGLESELLQAREEAAAAMGEALGAEEKAEDLSGQVSLLSGAVDKAEEALGYQVSLRENAIEDLTRTRQELALSRDELMQAQGQVVALREKAREQTSWHVSRQVTPYGSKSSSPYLPPVQGLSPPSPPLGASIGLPAVVISPPTPPLRPAMGMRPKQPGQTHSPLLPGVSMGLPTLSPAGAGSPFEEAQAEIFAAQTAIRKSLLGSSLPWAMPLGEPLMPLGEAIEEPASSRPARRLPPPGVGYLAQSGIGFDRIDRNGDGVLDRQEWNEATAEPTGWLEERDPAVLQRLLVAQTKQNIALTQEVRQLASSKSTSPPHGQPSPT